MRLAELLYDRKIIKEEIKGSRRGLIYLPKCRKVIQFPLNLRKS